MQANIKKYTQQVLEAYTTTHRNEAAIDPIKMERFNNIVLQIDGLINEHTIKEYEVDIIGNNSLVIQVTIDIGYFEEDVEESCFLQLLRECLQFEIHPGELSKMVFQFEGVWRDR